MGRGGTGAAAERVVQEEAQPLFGAEPSSQLGLPEPLPGGAF